MRTRALIALSTVAGVVALTSAPAWAAVPIQPVTPVAETAPVLNGGDAADDPAIWVNPSDPGASLIIGNDKKGALEVYDLGGARRQRITTGTAFWGNVDVRGDLVAAWNGGGIRVYRVNPATRTLALATDGNGVISTTAGEGVCLYQAPGVLYGFAISRSGTVRQYRFSDTDNDGRLEGTRVRQFSVGSEAEGCVADDVTGALYISEEDVALWRYSAAPTGGTTRTAVDRVVAAGGRIAPDAEGVTIAGSVVVVSAQSTSSPSGSYFNLYDRTTNAYLASFRVTDGPAADDCDGTDGITAHAGGLGTRWPSGLFICQDGNNALTGGTRGNQDFKLVPWSSVQALVPSVVQAGATSTTN